MARVQRNDSVAFGKLYDRHAARALMVAQTVCRDVGLAEDAVQEGFLSMWRGRDTYKPAHGLFRGWAMTTVRNRALDSARNRAASKRPQSSSIDADNLLEGASRSAHDEAVERSDQQELDNLLAQLPEAQAEVITLAFFGGLSHVEIAEQLGLPAGTVKGRMRLGMEKLRQDMDPPE